jgi:hypothetical protein
VSSLELLQAQQVQVRSSGPELWGGESVEELAIFLLARDEQSVTPSQTPLQRRYFGIEVAKMVNHLINNGVRNLTSVLISGVTHV